MCLSIDIVSKLSFEIMEYFLICLSKVKYLIGRAVIRIMHAQKGFLQHILWIFIISVIGFE